MRSLTGITIVLTLLAASGCSTVLVSQDYSTDADLSRFGTWRWQESVQPQTGDIRVDNPLMDKRIRRAVERHLTGRQFAVAPDQPDSRLTYHLTIDRKIQSDTAYTSVGVGGYYHPWYGGVGSETRIWDYDEGRLTIDIHDADSGELVWRGVGVYRFRAYDSPQAADEAIQHIVDKILQQFPPVNRP